MEECILSLKAQTLQSNILLSTSTPNDHIRGLCGKYGVPLYVNEGEHGITGDWNFALSIADAEYVTLAHQDDVYAPDYAARMLTEAEGRDPVLLFSDYYELRNGQKVTDTRNLKIKRLMNLGFRWFGGSRFVRDRVLSLGDPICCPAVTFHMKYCRNFRFDGAFKVSCDWEAWSRLSRLGRFVYIPEPLMGHRIHEDSATTALISDHRRSEEDYLMYARYWPKPIARGLSRLYRESEKSNQV